MRLLSPLLLALFQIVRFICSQFSSNKFIIDLLDTKKANSKYYNPHTFDPQEHDYQNDVRLATRDEMPDQVEASDIAEGLYSQMFMTELTWPPLFFGAWGAFEPDVSKQIKTEY